VTIGQRGPDTGPYAVDRLVAPKENPWHSWMRFGGFDFFKDATRAAICTWSGDVWLVAGLDDKLERLTWQRIATGLFQPLGLKIVDDQIFVLGRDQITRLHDLNGDGETDFYENFNNDCMTAEHFHEFAMDLQTDAAGDFYFMKGACHARDAQHPHHGTFFKVSKDGSRSEVIAKGFRAPNGLEITPQGEFFTTDQEGYWMPANRLNHIQPGQFHGNTWSWFPEGKPTTNNPPFCWIHPKVDRSPSTMAWVTSDRWGPLQNHLLSLSYGVGRIFIVMRETVDGVEQGGITPLPPEFETGIMRSRFSPRDGQFYTCGLFGWAGNKTLAGGFYRAG
jgi:glucose/arabinose dehydrogenase